jgi:hypothetical protein
MSQLDKSACLTDGRWRSVRGLYNRLNTFLNLCRQSTYRTELLWFKGLMESTKLLQNPKWQLLASLEELGETAVCHSNPGDAGKRTATLLRANPVLKRLAYRFQTNDAAMHTITLYHFKDTVNDALASRTWDTKPLKIAA